MKTILVDDELWMMELFEEECSGLPEVQIAGKFDCSADALDFARENRVDLAFLDIEMPEMNGLELAGRLRELYSDIIIIFVSAYDKYMPEAFNEQNADYFVSKPYTAKQVQAVLERAKLLSKRQAKPIFIHALGRFNVYIEGKPIAFRSKRAKEILAYIVMQYGNTVSNDELYLNIWGDDRAGVDREKEVFYSAFRKLNKTLKQAGAEEMLVSINGEYKINTDICDCDYYKLLEGDKEAIEQFEGKLMSEYSWAEPAVGKLSDRFQIYAEE